MNLVQGMPASIAISFLQCLPLATINRPAPRQSTKVAEGDLLVMVHAGTSLSIMALKLHGIPVASLSAAIVSMPTVVPRQTTVQILRSIDGLPEGLFVARTLNRHAAGHFRSNAAVLTALRAAS